MLNPTAVHWRALALFAVYHLVLGGALLLLEGHESIYGIGQADPQLLRTVAWVYLAGSPIALVLAAARQPAFELQIHAALIVDVVALTLIMRASGGIDSGVGLLLAISLAVGSLLTSGLSPFLFAALATFAVVMEQVFTGLAGAGPHAGFFHAALLGIAFFSIAGLDFILAQQLREREKTLREQELDLENLNAVNAFVIDLLDLGVIAVDADTRVRMLNEKAETWLGAQWQSGGMANLAALNHELDSMVDAWRGSPHGPGTRAESRTLKIGSRDLGIQFEPVGEKSRSAALILLRDMAQVQAEQHKTQLATIGQMSASLAHEIRNPLSAISQAAQLMQESDDNIPRHQRLTEIIVRNSQRLDRVIDNILTLARRRDPHQQDLDLGPFVERVALQIEMNAADPDLIVETTCNEPVTARVDPNHLEEVLHILADNAMKHGRAEEGKTRLFFSVEHATGGRVIIRVADNGQGIPPEMSSQIFDPFVSSRDSTGLGLFLARQLCEANESTLSLATSGADSGTEFHIVLRMPDSGFRT
jgi:two-component system sensor histidine kinase PilS (NtrC family)